MDKTKSDLAQQILASNAFSGKWTYGRISQIVNSLIENDRAVMRRRKLLVKLIYFSIFFIICGGIGLFVFVAVTDGAGIGLFSVYKTLLYILIPAVIVVSVVLIIKRPKERAAHYETTLQAILDPIKYDIKRESFISVKMPLASLDDPQYKKWESAPFSQGPYPDCIDHHYKKNFMDVKIRLSDLNQLVVSGKEAYRKRIKKKRNPLGKLKIKTKNKKKMVYKIYLAVNPDMYDCKPIDDTIITDEATKEKYNYFEKPKEKYKVIGIRYSKQMKFSEGAYDVNIPIVEADKVLYLVALLYRMLIPKKVIQSLAESE